MSSSHVSPNTAARLTGKSKTTILRAMNDGRLSYQVDDGGNRQIDRSELERVFGPLEAVKFTSRARHADNTADGVESELKRAADMLELERMKMRIKMLEDQLYMAREQIEDLKGQRDEWQKQAQQTLITSQHSQKQAEEFRAELKEKERKESERRAALEERMRRLKQQSQNQNTQNPIPQGVSPQALSFWERLRGTKGAA